MNGDELIVRAAAAFARRDLPATERDCRAALAADPASADATHLLGLVLKQQGDLAAAEPLLRKSIELAPRRTEFRVNLGNLLKGAGNLAAAESELRKALALEPGSRSVRLALARVLLERGALPETERIARALIDGDPADAEAWAALAGAERDQRRLEAAEASFRRAIAIEPDYAVARHNLGALLGSQRRARESLAELDHARRLGVTGDEIDFNRARALMELARTDEAQSILESMARRSPRYVEAQVLLAKLRYQRGDSDFARTLESAAATTGDVSLQLALGDLLRRAGDPVSAAEVLRGLHARLPGVPQIESSLAVALQEGGRLEEALRHARAALEAQPGDPVIAENLIAILLQLGRPEEAAPVISRGRARLPLDQRWLAYEAIAARLQGSARYEELYDYERFVRAYELQPPAGFSTIGEFNQSLGDALDELHTLRTHPLDQSLRHGTQSPRDLRFETHPAISGFFDAVEQPIESFRRMLGRTAGHPFLKRNRGTTKLTGCWSVRLSRGGYHVNHIHPEGWISSAYYVAVPREVADTATRCGWIKFGEPRMPTPGAGADHFIRPRAGLLVLFPSYMWHGTTPLSGAEARSTLAFDAVADEPGEQ